MNRANHQAEVLGDLELPRVRRPRRPLGHVE